MNHDLTIRERRALVDATLAHMRKLAAERATAEAAQSKPSEPAPRKATS